MVYGGTAVSTGFNPDWDLSLAVFPFHIYVKLYRNLKKDKKKNNNFGKTVFPLNYYYGHKNKSTHAMSH